MKNGCCSRRSAGLGTGTGSAASLALALVLPKCPACIPLYLAALGALGLGMETGDQLLHWTRVSAILAACILTAFSVRLAYSTRAASD